MSVNKVILIGHLGKDPEVRKTKDSKEVAIFSMATSESWKDKTTGERKSKSEWHSIVVFNPNLIKVAQSYLKKGSKIYLEGSIQTRKWQSKEGKEQYKTEIILQNFNGTIELLDKKESPTYDYQDNYVAPITELPNQEEVVEISDDIPF